MLDLIARAPARLHEVDVVSARRELAAIEFDRARQIAAQARVQFLLFILDEFFDLGSRAQSFQPRIERGEALILDQFGGERAYGVAFQRFNNSCYALCLHTNPFDRIDRINRMQKNPVNCDDYIALILSEGLGAA